jgi:hypothetical protein
MFFFNKKFKQLETMIEEVESNLLRRIQYYESQTMSAVARVDEAVRAVHNMVANVDYIQDRQHDIVLKINELREIVDILAQEPKVTTEIVSDTKPKSSKSKKKETPDNLKFSFKRGRPEGME